MSQVSIVTLTHNRGTYIREAIESVLNQNFRDFELIIIDNASSDNTVSIVNEYIKKDKRIRLIRNNVNLKIPNARNLGIREAEGKYIAVLDSDDVWLDKDKLKKQVNFLETHQDYALIGGRVVVIDEDGKKINEYLNPQDDLEIRQRILIKNPFTHSSVLFRKNTVLELGGYDEDLGVSEDYDLWLKIGKHWKFANLGEYLIKYRVHQQGITSQQKLLAAKNTKKLIQKHKDSYPNYYKALFIANLRIIRYSLPF